MKLTKDNYTISKDTLEQVLEALGNNWFSSNDEGEYNNDDIIAAQETLEKEIEKGDT